MSVCCRSVFWLCLIANCFLPLLLVVLLPYVFSWWGNRGSGTSPPCSAGTLYTSRGPKSHVFFAVALPKSSHEKLIPFVIASNRFPACETACQQISASVRNVSKPAICNYCIHWGIRTNGTQKDWPGLRYRCAYANRPQIQVTFRSQEQTRALLNFKMSLEDCSRWPK